MFVTLRKTIRGQIKAKKGNIISRAEIKPKTRFAWQNFGFLWGFFTNGGKFKA